MTGVDPTPSIQGSKLALNWNLMFPKLWLLFESLCMLYDYFFAQQFLAPRFYCKPLDKKAGANKAEPKGMNMRQNRTKFLCRAKEGVCGKNGNVAKSEARLTDMQRKLVQAV